MRAVGETDTLQHSPAAESCAAARNIIDVYYVLLSFFPRAAQGCSSYPPPPTLWIFSARCKTISITSHIFYPAEHICTFFAENVSFSRVAVLCCEGRAVAQWPSAVPDLLTQLSTAEAPSTAQLQLSRAQPHCGNPPEAALFRAKSS